MWILKLKGLRALLAALFYWCSKLFLPGKDHCNGLNKSYKGSGGIFVGLQKAERGTQTQSYAAEGFARQVSHVGSSQEDLT